jgi:flagellar hook assembly protein FlgD
MRDDYHMAGARPAHTVYDLAGRRIANLFVGRMDETLKVMTWDGTDDDGRRASPGMYLVRARVGPEVGSCRVVWLR